MTEINEAEVTTVRVLGKRETQRATKVLALEAIIEVLETVDYASVRDLVSASSLETLGYVDNDITADSVAAGAWVAVSQEAAEYRQKLEAAVKKLDAPIGNGAQAA